MNYGRSLAQEEWRRREETKALAWRVLNNTGNPLEERRDAALAIIGSHYERAMLGKGAYKPPPRCSLEQYISHWLWANGERLLAPDVRARLEEWHLPEQHPWLEKGMSCYFRMPPNGLRRSPQK